MPPESVIDWLTSGWVSGAHAAKTAPRINMEDNVLLSLMLVSFLSIMLPSIGRIWCEQCAVFDPQGSD